MNEQIITLGNELNPLKEQINELTTNLEFEQQKAKLLHEENERIKLAALSTDEQNPMLINILMKLLPECKNKWIN